MTGIVIYGSCEPDEVCLFSMYKLNNSHVATCDYYNYKVCCDDIASSTIRYGSCNPDEGAVISLYNLNNSHAARKNYYSYKVCAKFNDYPIECSVRTSCLANETCVVSLYQQTNSHVATCDYYNYKVCCSKLADLFTNESYITFNNTSPVVGDTISINITLWNIGDGPATSVNVSCYDNGVLFDSKIISSIPPDPSMNSPVFVECTLTSDCPLSHVIKVSIDPANEIKEYNETNNNASKSLSLTDRLLITITHPTNDEDVYRCTALSLNSTVSTQCGSSLSSYTVKWYNSTMQIASGENAYWCIGSSDGFLGEENITATVEATGFASGSDSVSINILNRPPLVSEIWYNVTPPEIHLGQAIQIACKVNDTHDFYCGGVLKSCVEDVQNNLDVNISVKRPAPYNDWSNITANFETPDTYYRDYGTDATYPLGKYTAVCSASDTDGGYNESISYFWVYQNATITLNLNATRVWWGDFIKVYGVAKYKDGSDIPQGTDVEISLNGDLVNLTEIRENGYYEGTFQAPYKIGMYVVTVNFTDPFVSSKEYGNYTYLYVSPYYGGTEREIERAKNVGCYEIPRFVQNPDGSIERVIVKVCVWK